MFKSSKVKCNDLRIKGTVKCNKIRPLRKIKINNNNNNRLDHIPYLAIFSAS